LGYPGEKQIAVYADHSEICKFDTEENPRYEQVIDHIEELVHSAIQESADEATAGTTPGSDPILAAQDYSKISSS
jgi:hypothetical protein